MIEKFFFNSSLPRSGSTLLQNIMAQNEKFYVTPTSGFLELVFGARANYSSSPEFIAQDKLLMQEAFRSFCYQGMLGFFNSITNKQCVLDKSRGWLYYNKFLNFFYPSAKIVCMVRDPRAILSSMEKRIRANPEKHNQLTDEINMQNITTHQRVLHWCNSPPFGLAMERLFQVINEGNLENILFLKFEYLTKNPNRELHKLYNFFNLPQFNHNFDCVQQVTIEDDSVYGPIGHHKIRKKVCPVPNDFDLILGKDLSQLVFERYKWFYDLFEYGEE